MIEDSAQGLGATLDGKMAGSWGLAGTFSFYPAKTLGAFGDAGAVITDDDDFAARIRHLRNHGRTPDGEIAEWSFNCRIDNLHAAMLDYKLQQLPRWIERRREIASVYDERLAGVEGLQAPRAPNGCRRAVRRVPELRDRRLRIATPWSPRLRERGVEILLPWGGKGVHQFKRLGLDHFDLPRADAFFAGALLLPMYPELLDEEAAYVADVVREFCEQPTAASHAA